MERKEFEKAYNAIVNRALFCAEKARREGLLALEEEIVFEKLRKREIMEYGLSFVVDGFRSELINKILTNIINQEAEDDKKILMTVQKEAVLSIAASFNPRLLIHILNSYVNIDNDEIFESLWTDGINGGCNENG
jgi:flagellar motor component MotA